MSNVEDWPAIDRSEAYSGRICHTGQKTASAEFLSITGVDECLLLSAVQVLGTSALAFPNLVFILYTYTVL